MTEVQLAYIAGHFDGEGCIHIDRTKYRRVRVQVGCTYLPVLELYKELFEGKVYSKTVGPERKPMWVWTSNRQIEAIRFLLRVEPYLMEKRAQASEALRLLAEHIK